MCWCYQAIRLFFVRFGGSKDVRQRGISKHHQLQRSCEQLRVHRAMATCRWDFGHQAGPCTCGTCPFISLDFEDRSNGWRCKDLRLMMILRDFGRNSYLETRCLHTARDVVSFTAAVSSSGASGKWATALGLYGNMCVAAVLANVIMCNSLMSVARFWNRGIHLGGRWCYY